MIINKTRFRASKVGDHLAIAHVHKRAFNQETEGELAVALLIDTACQTLDLVESTFVHMGNCQMVANFAGPKTGL
ncbi:MAG: hypothetical protein AAFR27_05970, partial [Pseudomonadota bacterium]